MKWFGDLTSNRILKVSSLLWKKNLSIIKFYSPNVSHKEKLYISIEINQKKSALKNMFLDFAYHW